MSQGQRPRFACRLPNRQAPVIIDQVFSGVMPVEIPVQGPTHYELFLNLRTARDLGLTIPPTLIAFADKVIE